MVKRPRTLKMAPPGFHVVKRHTKILENGIKYFVKAHLTKNRGKQAILLPENILRSSAPKVDEFLDKVSDEAVSIFCSNFSSPEKLLVIKALIKDGPLNQKELLALTKLTQGQFYHHIKDLISGKFIHKIKKDQYDITPMGHVLALSFMGIIHSFSK